MLGVRDVRAEFNSGSDGSDGALNCAWLAKDPAFDCEANCLAVDPDNPGNGPCTFIVDLSKANSTPGTTYLTPGGDRDGDGFGDGVYDAKQWAVVYKFSTIDIPANVIVTFKNHPSGAPVVWLAQGDVNIDGRIELKGSDGAVAESWPVFSEPGPGGFAGGAPADLTTLVGSVGFGPGSSENAGHGNNNPNAHGCYSGILCYAIARGYGNADIFPLIGGSGGGVASPNSSSIKGVTGGAGGGAILIATNTEMSLSNTAYINATGGADLCASGYQINFAGSGGAIRLIARSSMTMNGLVNNAGGYSSCGRGYGGYGRIRLEAPVMTPTNLAQPAYAYTTSPIPGEVFPGSNAPTLEVVSITTNNNVPVAAPADPIAGPGTVEIPLDTDQASQVVIRARNIPTTTAAGPTKITVRVVPLLGNEIIATSTALQAQPDGTLRATANIAFPPGRSEIQLRVDWTNP